MNRIDENLWPAIEPPSEFAERAVDRMLAQGNVIVLEPTRRHRRLKIAGLLAAAVFISGAAFGYAARSVRSSSPAASDALPLLTQPFSSMQQRVVQVTAPKVSGIKATTVPVMPKVGGQEAALPIPSASTSSTSYQIPRVPACQCQRGFADVICDCY